VSTTTTLQMPNGPASSAIFHLSGCEADHARTCCAGFLIHLLCGVYWLRLALPPVQLSPWQTVFYHFRRLCLNSLWCLRYATVHRPERKSVGCNPTHARLP
jgi:hypothetical protein